MDEDEGFKAEAALNSASLGRGFLSPMEKNPGALLQLTNPENELFKLELALKGKRVNFDGKIESTGEPLLNDKGINSILSQAQSLINQVSIVSNLEKSDIENLIMFSGDTLIKDLMLKRSEYEIRLGARDTIHSIFLSTIFVTLKRAQDEGERRFWRGSQHEITTKIDGLKGSGSGIGNLFRNSFK